MAVEPCARAAPVRSHPGRIRSYPNAKSRGNEAEAMSHALAAAMPRFNLRNVAAAAEEEATSPTLSEVRASAEYIIDARNAAHPAGNGNANA
mmetsp:Transcript_38457/g.115301  ORF Transcript_38457/g.115301 Transcript_38457/m.115301 type:complete len:92 (-) Transcript_38457:537-812(-)